MNTTCDSDRSDAEHLAAKAAPPLMLRYAVIACEGEWRVLSNRAQIGHFASRAEALVVAVGLTKQALAEGHAAELLAQPEGPDAALMPLFKADLP